MSSNNNEYDSDDFSVILEGEGGGRGGVGDQDESDGGGDSGDAVEVIEDGNETVRSVMIERDYK